MGFSMNEKKALSVIPHITGFSSVLGSSSILYDIWNDRQRKLRRPYYRILLGMSVMDVMCSFSIGLSTWPIPRGTEGVYAALGNTHTCTAQGFFNQLLLTSPLYNLMLATYYLLLGQFGLSDEEIARRYEPFMHAFAIVPSFGMAVAGLPLTLYNSANLWCWIASFPSDCENSEGERGPSWPCERGSQSWLYRWAFFYGPLWFVIALTTLVMIMLTRSVAREEMRAIESQKQSRLRRPSYRQENTRRTSALPVHREDIERCERSRRLFYQALFYVGIFYLTWFFATVNRFVQLINGQSYFSLMFLHSIFVPFQGFFNFLVYRHGPCVA